MKKLILLLATAFLVLGLAGTSMAVPFDGSEYQVVYASGISWESAKINAESIDSGWHLVSITSQEEQDFLATMLGEQNGMYWAGGFQTVDPNLGVNEGWNWVTGELWGFTAWANDVYPEPNDWGGANEIYLALDGRTFTSGSPRNWTWNDGLTTDGILGYVAERTAPVPEPATMLLLASGLVGLAGFRRKFRRN